MDYRGEIDGLRAIAIASVVAYHVGLPGTPGGFVGVDIFFVISGYLITSLLLNEKRQRGSIDLLDFYARRARRLLPAFLVVLLASMAAAVIFLLPLPEEMGDFARSARFAAFYASNLHFAQSSGGYFDAPTELMPLLHSWSLAVEEQFYIGWPLLLIVCFVVARRWRLSVTALVTCVILTISVVSFAVNLNGAGREGRLGQAAFYMLHSRAWELGVGAGLALLLPFVTTVERSIGSLLCAAGLLGIGAAIAQFDATIAYPGTAALLPVMSTAAVIAGASMVPGGLIVRGLRARPLVALGLVSYSWYLWHWPLLAFARVSWLGERDIIRDASLATVALILACLTYLLIENPIRKRRIWKSWSNQKVLGASAVSAMLLVLVSGTLDYRTHAIARDPAHPFAPVLAATVDAVPKRRRCNNGSSLTELRMLDECSTPAPSGKRVVLWGDSHADHLAHMVASSSSTFGIGMLARIRGGCPPLPGMTSVGEDFKQTACAAFNELVLSEIEHLSKQDVVGVIISTRWTAMQGKALLQTSPASLDGELTPQLRRLDNSLRQTIDRLTRLGLKVLIFGPIPDQRYAGPSCVARRPPQQCSVPLLEQQAYRADVIRALDAISKDNDRVRLADPLDQLCGAEDCPILLDGTLLYRDDDHLSVAGAMRLLSWFGPYVEWLAAGEVQIAKDR